MWNYERRLEFPVNIKAPNAMLAQAITSQYGGPDGEMGASMRYLSQRYACPYREVAAVLTDIGTEELAHLEMVAAIVHQLTKNLSMEEIEEAGFANYYVDHTIGIWPQAAGGVPFNACEFQSKGDIITDLTEDMAAEQKARSTYDNILRLVRDDPDVCEPIKFLRAREIVHFQRFGEANRTDLSKNSGESAAIWGSCFHHMFTLQNIQNSPLTLPKCFCCIKWFYKNLSMSNLRKPFSIKAIASSSD